MYLSTNSFLCEYLSRLDIKKGKKGNYYELQNVILYIR